MSTVRTDFFGIGGWLNHASTVLGAAGIATPRYDAERLAAHILGVPWGRLPRQPRGVAMQSSDVLSDEARSRLDAALARRAGGEPLAYIEGSRGFYGLELACGPGVLVPRPETEVLVDVALELIDDTPAPVVVDLGTGTGAIALAVAMRRPDAEIVATDVSEEALAYARINARATGSDVWLSCGDLFDAVPDELRGRVDLLVCNPPYVRADAELPPDVRAEPEIALFGGDDGLVVIRRIVDEGPAWLSAGGAIAIEIGDEHQATAVCASLVDAQVRADLTGRPRVVWARS